MTNILHKSSSTIFLLLRVQSIKFHNSFAHQHKWPLTFAYTYRTHPHSPEHTQLHSRPNPIVISRHHLFWCTPTPTQLPLLRVTPSVLHTFTPTAAQEAFSALALHSEKFILLTDNKSFALSLCFSCPTPSVRTLALSHSRQSKRLSANHNDN